MTYQTRLRLQVLSHYNHLDPHEYTRSNEEIIFLKDVLVSSYTAN